jgi:hypothetical protein
LNTPFQGTEEIGNPDDRLNKQHTVILVGEVGLSERFSLQGLLPLRSFDITGREEISAEGAGDAARDRVNTSGDGRGSSLVPNRGGRQTRLVGGLVFGLKSGQNLGLQANYLLDANVNGDQLVARTEYILGWQVSLGTHRHRIEQ